VVPYCKCFYSWANVGMFDWLTIMEIPGLSTVISVLLGFGLAAIFRPLCKGPDCIVMRGPPVHDIHTSVYQFGTKCVEFKAKAMECPKDTQKSQIVETLSFAELG